MGERSYTQLIKLRWFLVNETAKKRLHHVKKGTRIERGGGNKQEGISYWCRNDSEMNEERNERDVSFPAVRKPHG